MEKKHSVSSSTSKFTSILRDPSLFFHRLFLREKHRFFLAFLFLKREHSTPTSSFSFSLFFSFSSFPRCAAADVLDRRNKSLSNFVFFFFFFFLLLSSPSFSREPLEQKCFFLQSLSFSSFFIVTRELLVLDSHVREKRWSFAKLDRLLFSLFFPIKTWYGEEQLLFLCKKDLDFSSSPRQEKRERDWIDSVFSIDASRRSRAFSRSIFLSFFA